MKALRVGKLQGRLHFRQCGPAQPGECLERTLERAIRQVWGLPSKGFLLHSFLDGNASPPYELHQTEIIWYAIRVRR